MAKNTEEPKRPRQFGVFYPRGYCIVTFEKTEDAERARRALLEGGYAEDDVEIMSTDRVREGTAADLEHLSPVLKALGSEQTLIEMHQAGAAAGHTFLIAYAPSDLDTERFMNVIRRGNFVKAHKYDRFTLRTL